MLVGWQALQHRYFSSDPPPTPIDKLPKLLQKGQKKLVLDITGLDYVDSSGIGMLVSCLTNAKKAGGELKLAGANPRIRRILAMTGVDTMMPMFDTLAAATA